MLTSSMIDRSTSRSGPFMALMITGCSGVCWSQKGTVRSDVRWHLSLRYGRTKGSWNCEWIVTPPRSAPAMPVGARDDVALVRAARQGVQEGGLSLPALPVRNTWRCVLFTKARGQCSHLGHFVRRVVVRLRCAHLLHFGSDPIMR